MMDSKEENKEKIRMIVEEARRPLSKWEEGFMESVSEQIGNTGSITDTQEEILEKIYREKV